MSNVCIKGSVLPAYSKIKSNLEKLKSVQRDPNRDNISQELSMLQVIATKLEGLEKQLGDMKQEHQDRVTKKRRVEKEKRQKKDQKRREKDQKRANEDKRLKDMMKEFSLLKQEYGNTVKILKTSNWMFEQAEIKLKKRKKEKKERQNKNKMKAVVTNNTKPVQQSKSKPKAFETITIPSVSSSPSSKKAKTNEMVDVTNRHFNSSLVGQSSEVQQSKGQQINEGASCSGVITNKGSQSKIASKQNITSGKSLNSGSNIHLEDLLRNEFRCSICHELYINPIGLACSHIFCSFCIEQWRVNNAKCPICDIKIFEMSPQHFLTNVVGKIVNIMDEESKKRRSEVIKKRSDHYLRKHDFKCI